MNSRRFSSPVWIAAIFAGGMATATAATPLGIATVTHVENKATVAEIKAGQVTGAHPAVVAEVIRANNFLQTASTARAELEFNDKSLVRVGPNSVFSFDAQSRTLSLEKGDMLFYLPPGKGGVQIKTAALTAAITGTVALISRTHALCLDGKFTVTCMVNGKEMKVELVAGTDHNAVKLVNGKLVLYKSDAKDPVWSRSRAKLVLWQGVPLPGDAERKIAQYSPWAKETFEDSEEAAIQRLLGEAGVGFDSDLSRLANRALESTTKTITGVLPGGLVGIFDSFGTFLGLK